MNCNLGKVRDSRRRQTGSTFTRIGCIGLAQAVLLLCLVPSRSLSADTSDPVLNLLLQKGIITEGELQKAREESEKIRTNNLANSMETVAPSSKWKISDAIKYIELYGDIRLRYEYRSADNYPAVTGDPNETYRRERFRYALRVGLRGDLYDDFYYGFRLDTSSNPRSPWVTFGSDTVNSSLSSTPSAKNDDTIAVGLVYLGWRPTSWFETTLGKMPNPLYTTAMVWDSDINPEGAAEKFKASVGRFDLFATFGQFVYQDTNPDINVPSDDTFILAWQLGTKVNLAKDVSLKVAPVIYSYTGVGQTNNNNTQFFGPGSRYTGQGLFGANGNAYVNGLTLNQSSINDLLVLEIPAEFNFKIGRYQARIFGDYAYNIYGYRRADAAAAAFPPTSVVPPGGGPAQIVGLTHPYTSEVHAYQVGAAFGNLGLVYGQTSKKNTWEARAYYQHTEAYAVDVNLIDSDFFEGRANLEGVYTALAYSITDGIIATARYGYAHPINSNLGTGGSNPDLPNLNPINNYNLIQLDLTWRF
jgi:hypothetical protein